MQTGDRDNPPHRQMARVLLKNAARVTRQWVVLAIATTRIMRRTTPMHIIRRTPLATALAALSLGLAVAASAHEGASEGILGGGERYLTVLTSGQVVSDPLPASNASGLGLLTYDPKANELCFTLTYGGLVGIEQAMGVHLHGPAHPGEHTPNMIAHLPGAGSPRNDCIVLAKDDAKALRKGLTYIVVHTDVFPSGELRGQVIRLK
jgi:hypothetical protein